jgi:hypothetical protein
MSTSSARSSVAINLDQSCIPAATSLQAFPTSGFYAGTRSLSSMRCQRRTGLAEGRKASRHISPRSSQFVLKVCCVAHRFVSSFPRLAASKGAAFFWRGA